jgi:anti-sigma factor RsiW
MSTNHPLSDETLLCYQDGELPQAEMAPVRQHLEQCGECRERFEQLRKVSIALAGYSDSLGEPGESSRAETTLADALRQSASPEHRIPFAARWWRLVPACAAVAVLGTVLVLRWPARQVPAPPPAAQSGTADRFNNGFIALPYSDQNLSPEGAVVIQVEVPRSALLLAGAPASDTQGDERVKAEVVVGADGLARAIRFLN